MHCAPSTSSLKGVGCYFSYNVVRAVDIGIDQRAKLRTEHSPLDALANIVLVMLDLLYVEKTTVEAVARDNSYLLDGFLLGLSDDRQSRRFDDALLQSTLVASATAQGLHVIDKDIAPLLLIFVFWQFGVSQKVFRMLFISHIIIQSGRSLTGPDYRLLLLG